MTFLVASDSYIINLSMLKQSIIVENIKIDKIVGGGQSLAELPDGRKLFIWGALPGEVADIQLSKQKRSYAEGVAVKVHTLSPERIEPRDPGSYLSTSPWQIMTPEAELHYKSALIEEAFELHSIVLPNPIETYSDGQHYAYRNKVEFSWYGHEVSGQEQLDLAFFKRGSRGKVAVEGTSLAPERVNQLARQLRDLLQARGVTARQLKTVIIRTSQTGKQFFQLYVKDKTVSLDPHDLAGLKAGGEVIYSNPQSPASVITERLQQFGSDISLTDQVLDIPFRYSVESFFQINIPIYERALEDMRQFISQDKLVVDMYSGVGSIGLTVGGDDVTLVESNEYAVREMKRNIEQLHIPAKAVQASSEQALEYIDASKTIIVDPPRAGLHQLVINRLLEVGPDRIIYLSCNPITQARDVERLSSAYGVKHHQGYNFFPRTPHIEHLVVLDKLNF